MSEAATLAWMLKLEEAEGLLRNKQVELAAQLELKRGLEQQVKESERQGVNLRCELLQRQEALARAKHRTLSSQQEAEDLQELLESDGLLPMAMQCDTELHDKVKSIKTLVDQERERMQQWQQVCTDPDGPMAHLVASRKRVAALRARLQHVEANVMPALRVQLDSTDLERQLNQVQGELHQAQGACSTLEEQQASLRARTQEAEQQLAAAERKLEAVRAAARITALERKVREAQQEQSSLQAQLEGMEAWLQTLKNGQRS